MARRYNGRIATTGWTLMASIRIAMAQFDFPVGDVAGNTERIIEMIGQARDEYGAELVMFPELAVSGYPPEDLLLRPGFLYECEQAMMRIAGACRGITAVVGWPQAAGAVVYNAASVLRDGLVEQTYRKRELPNYAVFDERRYFDVDPDGGSCVFEVNGIPVGLLICEDLWFAEPLADTVRAGAQLVVVPNASPYERGKHAQRDALLAERTRESGAAIAYLNVVGGQDALVFDGASVVADGDGTVHPAAAAFTDQWLVVDYDAATRRFMPREWIDDGDESMDALAWRAVTRGIQDYCRKNGFKKVWLGLSGGIDSALVLAIAVDALGAENVTAVRMPSRYTADLSNDLAQEQCDAMGVKLIALPIEKPFPLVDRVVLYATYTGGKALYLNGELAMNWRDIVTGKGKISYPSGASYDGQWAAGVMTGTGTLRNADGSSYTGAVVAGKPEGRGEMTYADGYSFDGTWDAGQREGRGKATWADGTTYEGSFKSDQRHGNGILTQPDGFTYDGDWLEGEMHGIGKATYPTGDIYEGGFAKGKRQGPGKLTYKTG